jgi:flagellin
MLAIKNNLVAENAQRMLGVNYDALGKSVQRLSSGLRINSAADDAAGLAVRELLRADTRVLRQAARNAQDAISMLQTGEQALQVVDNLLIRMKELAEQAATGSYTDAQRTTMNDEFASMRDEITRIATAIKFNGVEMLNSASGSLTIHVGTGNTANVDKVTVTLQSTTATGLGINALDISSQSGAASALVTLGTAINTKDDARANFGAMINRFEATVNVINVQAENLATAESRISDVDVATEMSAFTRNQVMAQAGIAMLAQANALPSLALTLLRG